MVVIDTSVIIDHLRLQKRADSQLMKIARENPKEILALSLISVQELWEGHSTKDEEKEHYLLSTISPLKILPYTYEIAELAGKIARDINRPIEFADAAIAATAITNGSSIVTLNKKDFTDINHLQIL